MNKQEELGERMARLRRSLGWSQTDLAQRVGAKATQISKYERGACKPKVSVLSRIAAALGTSTDFLLTGKEDLDETDQLLALWPSLEQLPLGLRNQIAWFLRTVLRAQALLGPGEVDGQQPPGRRWTSSVGTGPTARHRAQTLGGRR